MTTPNPNPDTTSTARAATQLIVRRGDDEGNAPGVSEETEELRVLTINRFAGGRRIDHCELEVDLGASGQRLQDLETPEAWSQQIEVRVPDPDDPLVSLQTPFWGETGVQQLRLGRGEGASVIASIEPYHFGDVLTGIKVWDSTNDAVLQLDLDPVFNPLIDETIENNMDSKLTLDLAAEDDGYPHHLWLDPERVRDLPANQYHEDSTGLTAFPAEWTIPKAAQALCGLCNPDETFIKNPSIDETADIWTDAPEIKNLRMRRGRYLPTYLDELLHPLGFDWFVDITQDDDGDLVREIVVFKRGSGTEKEIFFQAAGESLDLEKQNVQELRSDTSIVDLANRIIGHGSLKQAEVTIPLYRGWDESGGVDSFSADDLMKEDEDGVANSDFETYPNVHRLWVANEAGDYIGFRDDFATPPDFSTLFSKMPTQRRKLDRTLTLDANGKRRKPFLEWSVDAGSTWYPWDSSLMGRYRLLEDQIGLYFDEKVPPSELVDAGDDARLRITGTITADERISHTVEKRDSSPNLRDVTLFLDLSDRFHERSVITLGTFASSLVGGAYGADEVDDSTALQEYLEDLQLTSDSAFISARIELHGLHFDYQIGDLVPQVAGRNISFNRNSPGVEEKRYLQIAGISWDRGQQSTTLHVVSVEDR